MTTRSNTFISVPSVCVCVCVSVHGCCGETSRRLLQFGAMRTEQCTVHLHTTTTAMIVCSLRLLLVAAFAALPEHWLAGLAILVCQRAHKHIICVMDVQIIFIYILLHSARYVFRHSDRWMLDGAGCGCLVDVEHDVKLACSCCLLVVEAIVANTMTLCGWAWSLWPYAVIRTVNVALVAEDGLREW